jgi:predicted choloylglycine hydrolase
MGQSYGSGLAKLGYRLQVMASPAGGFTSRCLREIRRFSPELMEEIRGVADGLGAPMDDVVSLLSSVGLSNHFACSAFAAASPQGTLLAQNYDFFYEFRKFTEGRQTRPEGEYQSVQYSDIMVGCENGMNERGLSVGLTWVPSRKIAPGVSFALLARSMLDKCATTREALRMISNAKHMLGINYLLADGEGDLAVAETSPDCVTIRRPEGNWLVATNHYVTSKMQAHERGEWVPEDSLHRYDSIEGELARSTSFNSKRAQMILSSHSGRVCSHRGDLGTIWSFVSTQHPKGILISDGHPCLRPYASDSRISTF